MTEKTQVYAAIGRLVRYGLRCGLLPEEEFIYARNLLLGELQLDDYIETDAPDSDDLSQILHPMIDYAVENGLTRGDSATARDLFDTRPVSYTHLFKILHCLAQRIKILPWIKLPFPEYRPVQKPRRENDDRTNNK